MRFTIYAVRLKGDEAKSVSPHFKPAKNGWLREHEAQLETVALAHASTREEACAVERQMVTLCLALNHRLLNSWLMPSDRRAA